MYRFEKKFKVENLTVAQVRNIIKLNPIGFVEEYPSRRVNSIYFDTQGLRSYSDNVEGISERTKVRLRWYGVTKHWPAMQNLEFKIRKNQLGEKRVYPTDKVSQSDFQNADIVKLLGDESRLNNAEKSLLHALQPVLLNTYQRDYYRSADQKYRITLDYNLQFSEFKKGRDLSKNIFRGSFPVIVEMKYAAELESEAVKISQRFPFRMTKSSKYVLGVKYLLGN